MFDPDSGRLGMAAPIPAARWLERYDFCSIVELVQGCVREPLIAKREAALESHVKQRKALFHKHYAERAAPLNFKETPHL